MNMTKAQANTIINTLFAAIPDFGSGFQSAKDKMYDLEKAAEKQHRYGRTNGPAASFTVGQAAKYFTIQHLFAGATASYTIEDMISIRHEALLGCAYARRYSEELKFWMEAVHGSKFAEIDYAELMK